MSSCGRTSGTRAPLAPRGPLAVDEIILDDPVLVRLAHHRPHVVDAGAFLEVGDVLGGRRGGDAIHHGARVPHLLLEPRAQRVVALGGVARGADDALLGHLAVVGKVVAGHHGEGPAAEAMTRRERGEDEAKDGGFRAGGVDGLGHGELGVVEDALVGEFEELVVALVEGDAVAELGDGQRDDLGGGRREESDHGGGVFKGQEHVAEGDNSWTCMSMASTSVPSRATMG